MSPHTVQEWPVPSRADKVRRVVWRIVETLVYRLIPVPFYSVRCTILRMFGGKIAKGARPYPGARVWAPWNLEMHRNSCIANGVECYNVASVVVGENATVSQRASLCTASHDFRSPRHPLVARGCPSIWCEPCTHKVAPGEDPRSGRWKGWDKTECGIHKPGEEPFL